MEIMELEEDEFNSLLSELGLKQKGERRNTHKKEKVST